MDSTARWRKQRKESVNLKNIIGINTVRLTQYKLTGRKQTEKIINIHSETCWNMIKKLTFVLSESQKERINVCIKGLEEVFEEITAEMFPYLGKKA